MKTILILLTSAACSLLLSSCTALMGDTGKPLTQDEHARLFAGQLSPAERRQFFCERELTEAERRCLDEGPPIYVHTDYGSVMVGGARIRLPDKTVWYR